MARIAMSHNGEFATLNSYYNSYAAMTNASGPAFTLAGSRRGTETINQNGIGYYWSRTAVHAEYASEMFFQENGSVVKPDNDRIKWLGGTLRCVNQN